MTFNDHPRIRFKQLWKGREPGTETTEIPYGMAQQLVRRGIVELVETSLAPSDIQPPAAEQPGTEPPEPRPPEPLRQKQRKR
ncbi:MAG TPA: hypothetical protein VKI17_10625 [Gemmataceae bacterium]|nr:hypothetical protein [Gemmataceae bacterium]